MHYHAVYYSLWIDMHYHAIYYSLWIDMHYHANKTYSWAIYYIMNAYYATLLEINFIRCSRRHSDIKIIGHVILLLEE